ncbi:MAG TPA: hypothetical protein VIG48_02995 [Jatrophihabitans sp.]|jgi:hypothetical protein
MPYSAATPAERRLSLPGDDLVADAIAQLDRAATFAVAPATLWPWIVQLGKDRAGWYLPRSAERLIPRSRRAIRHIDARWQHVAVGTDVPDWGPGTPVLRGAVVDAPNALVWHSLRDRTAGHRWPATDPDAADVLAISWTLALRAVDDGTRLHHRLRIRARHRSLVKIGGGFDLVTVVGMFAGLRERVTA